MNHAASFAHEGTLGTGTLGAAVGADGREVGAGVGSGVGSGIGDHVGREVGAGVGVPSSEPPPQAQHISFDVKSWSS